MNEIYNIYCDESCHLENDRQKAMVLGAIWNPKSKSKNIAERIRELKIKHGLNKYQEIKWIKVSPNKQEFYLNLVKFFFECPDLHFRCVLIPDKDILRHEQFNQSHDLWYYKMYFVMLRQIFSPNDKYYIYLDIKDTKGNQKIHKLHEVLCNSMYDFSKNIIQDMRLVRSHEIEQVQLVDLLIGAISYLNRGYSGNAAKVAVIKQIKTLTGYSLEQTTLLKEDKFNILRWTPPEGISDV
ncbi:MAG: DUF3800 domain-containing protein [Planctomycetes bacterium]|nr:DUF3800 domain-containing protein [Planctomycetota bacterium]MBU1519045.1 DUF3800 domain-containing protein [Planctomycetota bacterium]MBU2457482.1 DUF3800 domain-containing protein [Planctomycetota bacterium]MBU2597446.1 DUF3800 domain-containing protein [Planctomycetota bacterium]